MSKKTTHENNWKKIKDTNEYQEYELTKVLKTSFKVDKDDLEKDNTLLDFLKKKQEEEFKKTILDQLKEELENEKFRKRGGIK